MTRNMILGDSQFTTDFRRKTISLTEVGNKVYKCVYIESSKETVK